MRNKKQNIKQDLQKISPEQPVASQENAVVVGAEASRLAIFTADDGTVKVTARLYENSVWLTQKGMADLYGVSVQNISYHLLAMFATGELERNSVIKEFLITATDGKYYKTQLYSLEAILHVGYRVNSPMGILFRQWSTERLKEYIEKGFTLDDDRLKYEDGYNFHFEELLRRIRDIRSTERIFYRAVRDVISISSVDYAIRKNEVAVRNFFAQLQNYMLYAVTGYTAAEIKCMRADASKPFVGLMHRRGYCITIDDLDVAKNYLDENELILLNNLVNMFLDYAEDQARLHNDMHLNDWFTKTESFLRFNERNILSGHEKKDI